MNRGRGPDDGSVYKETVVACVRQQRGRRVEREAQTFGTTTAELLRLGDWLQSQGCAAAVLEATAVYWKPVWHLLEDRIDLQLAQTRRPCAKSPAGRAMSPMRHGWPTCWRMG